MLCASGIASPGFHDANRGCSNDAGRGNSAPGGPPFAEPPGVSRSTIVNIVAASILVIHGLSHLPGFVGPWRLSAKFPYKTTILAGRLDVGDVGAKVVGGLWLLLVIDFAVVAWAAYVGAAWWPLGALGAASGSLLLCLVDWPEMSIGAVIDVALIVIIVIWKSGLGLIRLG
jgi:hypothetical protein